MQERDEEHFVGKIAQKAIIANGEKILIARDINDESTWELPGGRLNIHEEPKAGLARELFEELGVHCDIGNIIYAEQFMHQHEGRPALLLAYMATLYDPGSEFTLAPDEVAEVKWVSEQELLKYHIFDNCQRAIDEYFRQQ